MGGFEAFLRDYAEPLQYAAFFAALLALGAAEAIVAERPAELERKRRWPANVGLTIMNIIVLGAIPVSGIALADLEAEKGWGLFHSLSLPPLVMLVVGVLVRSLLGYAIHVAMHQVPLLWRVHRVHHSDLKLDVSTTVRFHPLEFVISVPLVLAAIVLLGISPVALIVYEILDAAMAVVTHANVRLPRGIERALATVLVTPSMHRIHHSAYQPETDSNYGAAFSWWDRLFGTYTPAGRSEVERLGLDEYRSPGTNSLPWLLALPFRAVRRSEAAAARQSES